MKDKAQEFDPKGQSTLPAEKFFKRPPKAGPLLTIFLTMEL